MRFSKLLVVLGLFILLSVIFVSYVSAEAVERGPGGAAEYTGEEGKVMQSEVIGLSAFVEESAAYRDNVVSTVARYKGKPYLYLHHEYIVIGNSRVAAVFRPINNELVALIDIYNGGKMLVYGNGPLWQLKMAEPSYKVSGFPSFEPEEGLIDVKLVLNGTDLAGIVVVLF